MCEIISFYSNYLSSILNSKSRGTMLEDRVYPPHSGRFETMIRPILSVALTATLLTACGQKAGEADNTKGPVVAASEAPRNDAVNTTPTTADLGPTAGANSFTEAQAKSAIEGAGYTNVGALTQDTNGIWTGTATKAGKQTAVAVDYKGAVTAS